MDPLPNAVRKLLDATHARLTSIGWQQGGISSPRADQPACLYYSLRAAAGLRNEETASDEVIAARHALLAELPADERHLGLAIWNDARGRTVDDVLRVIESARAKC